MNGLQLTIESQPAAQDIEFLEDRINEYNIAQTGFNDGKLLAIFVREADTMVAGLFGWTWGGCCEVRFLWVHEQRRGQGYGTQLLLTAEQEAAARGCLLITLDTHQFQAPAFYQKHGYEVFGVLDGYPLGYKKYCLRKPLAPAPATPEPSHRRAACDATDRGELD
jgi:GNAT superfamily N-acetyltransferase